MSMFDPESTRNNYEIWYELTGKPGDPYRFHMSFDVNGKYFEINNMSMGDVADLNRQLARTISNAKRDRREQDGRQ